MKHTLLAAAALVGIETAALACSCLATDDPVEMQKLAVDVTRNALALVEAEALTSYNQTPAGERMKVIRTLAGSAPAQFQIQRRPFASKRVVRHPLFPGPARPRHPLSVNDGNRRGRAAVPDIGPVHRAHAGQAGVPGRRRAPHCVGRTHARYGARPLTLSDPLPQE